MIFDFRHFASQMMTQMLRCCLPTVIGAQWRSLKGQLCSKTCGPKGPSRYDFFGKQHVWLHIFLPQKLAILGPKLVPKSPSPFPPAKLVGGEDPGWWRCPANLPHGIASESGPIEVPKNGGCCQLLPRKIGFQNCAQARNASQPAETTACSTWWFTTHGD